MSRRRAATSWQAGARDRDDVVGGRPLRDRPERAPSRRWDDDPPVPPRSRRQGWNRHVGPDPDARAGGRPGRPRATA